MFNRRLLATTASTLIGLACIALIALQVPPPANEMPTQYAQDGHVQLVLLGVGVVVVVVVRLIGHFHSGETGDTDADRGQLTTPTWMPATLIGLAVLAVVLEHVGLL